MLGQGAQSHGLIRGQRQLVPMELSSPVFHRAGGSRDRDCWDGEASALGARPAGARSSEGSAAAPAPSAKPAIELFSRRAAAELAAEGRGSAGAAWSEAAAALGRSPGRTGDPASTVPGGPARAAPAEELWANWAAAGQDLRGGPAGARRVTGAGDADEALQLPVALAAPPAAAPPAGVSGAGGQAAPQVSLLDM